MEAIADDNADLGDDGDDESEGDDDDDDDQYVTEESEGEEDDEHSELPAKFLSRRYPGAEVRTFLA